MLSDDIPSTKNSSIFQSLFSRKKRMSRSVTESSDDNKKVTSPSTRFLTNGKTNSNTNITHTNGYSNLGNSEMIMAPSEPASTSWAKECQLPLSLQKQQQQHEPERTDFTDHKRYYKNSRMHQPENHLPSQSDILSNARSRSESRSMLEKTPVLPKKAYSVSAMNYHSDPGYLMEALETLADAQPRVARSIPKHAIIDTSNFAARSLDNCLFDATVYDAMLHDSLKVYSVLKISYILSDRTIEYQIE